MCFPLGKFTIVLNGSLASNTAYRSPSFWASFAAANPLVPPPMMARSSTSSAVLPSPSASSSLAIRRTAFTPALALNLSSGMPVRSPTIVRPATLVVPSGSADGSFSTPPAGHIVWSQWVYRARGFAFQNDRDSAGGAGREGGASEGGASEGGASGRSGAGGGAVVDMRLAGGGGRGGGRRRERIREPAARRSGRPAQNSTAGSRSAARA